MKSLMRSYKSAKDNAKSTGASTPVFPFLELMDDIFGDRPVAGCSHTINSCNSKPCSSSKFESDAKGPSKQFSGKHLKYDTKKDVLLQKRNLFEDKKKLLLFLNEQKNERSKAMVEALKNKRTE